jgi:hypothetical protein
VMVLAEIVDVKELWETVAAAMVAGVGITATFSLMIFGAARYSDASRSGNNLVAVAAGLLTVVSLLVTTAAIVVGLIVMTTK